MQPSEKIKQAKAERQKITFDIGDLCEIFETTSGGARKIMRTVKQGASDPDGKWSYYYPNGSPQRTQSYKDGRRHGTATTYNRTGKLIQEADYEAGKKHGKFIQYNEKTREVDEHYIYEYGKIVKVKVSKNPGRK